MFLVMKHAIEYVLVVAIAGVMRILPRRTRRACGRVLGSVAFAVDARHRRVTIDNVSRAYGDEKTESEKRAIAEGAFRHFGAMVFELMSFGSPTSDDIDALVELKGVERYTQARAKGQGVILTTGHFGNWEVHGVAHGFRFGPVHVLARVQDNPYLNRWLEKIRSVSGNRVVYKQNALSQLRRLLKGGETVALVIDQNVHLEDAVFVDFFGRKAATTPVPAWFALKMGAALMPAFCYPLADGRYRAEYAEPIDVDRYRQMERNEAVLAITQELARVQEHYIRQRPECWLWMHRRWKTRPPEEAAAGESIVDTASVSRDGTPDTAAVPELR